MLVQPSMRVVSRPGGQGRHTGSAAKSPAKDVMPLRVQSLTALAAFLAVDKVLFML